MKLVILITARVEQGLSVAQAWQDVGAPGVTIVRTHGLRTLQEQVKRGSVELPLVVTSMAAAMAHVLASIEAPGEMLLSVVNDDMVEKLEEAATHVLGDLTEPYSGVMIVLDIERAIGVRHHTEQGKKS
jgi:nitrogen regulatory protein PII